MNSSTLTRLDEALIEEVMLRAEQYGVDLELSVDREGHLWIGQITRRNGAKGAGRRVVEMVCELADEAQVLVRLVVIGWLDNVIAIYRDAGFHEADTTARDIHDDYIFMERAPA